MNSTKTEVTKLQLMTDIRSVIGTVLLIFGVFLLICAAAVGTDPAQLAKTGGVNANLWAGLGLAIVGAVMWIWALVSPDGGKSPDVLEEQKKANK